MKASKIGILSALAASLCCVGPLVLVLMGLGGLGLGAWLGRYHWWFILTAIALLAFAWRGYMKEAGRCRAASCEMVRGTMTRTVLILASLVVATFVSLNVYTYAGQSRHVPAPDAVSTSEGLTTVRIPVEGMTCFTCELTVESNLKHLSGVESVDAKVNERVAYVRYDPARVSLDELIAAINKTGYWATRPSKDGGEG